MQHTQTLILLAFVLLLSSIVFCRTTTTSENNGLIHDIAASAIPLNDNEQEFNLILNSISDDTRVVMIGESSHGTHQYYTLRAELTKRLIQEKGFTIVTAEADYPAADRVNRYVKSYLNSNDRNSVEALSDFQIRFPKWMWYNTVMKEFVEWMKEYNEDKHYSSQISFHGLDMYSLEESKRFILKYLDQHNGWLADQVRTHYSCFERYGDSTHLYGRSVARGIVDPCTGSVKTALEDIIQFASYVGRNISNIQHTDELLSLIQNAKVVRSAERYYTVAYTGSESTWNIRDRHMMESLQDILEYYSMKHHRKEKIIVWAHNSHLGDASERQSKRVAEINVGQLIREHFGLNSTFNIGFTTFTGSVTAADNWGEDHQTFSVNEALEESYEHLFHRAVLSMPINNGTTNTLLLAFRSNNYDQHLVPDHVSAELAKDELLERAIGVIYRPFSERPSHYFNSRLSKRFDAVIHVDTTRALTPL
jgi:erythromycin esterase-like protein